MDTTRDKIKITLSDCMSGGIYNATNMELIDAAEIAYFIHLHSSLDDRLDFLKTLSTHCMDDILHRFTAACTFSDEGRAAAFDDTMTELCDTLVNYYEAPIDEMFEKAFAETQK